MDPFSRIDDKPPEGMRIVVGLHIGVLPASITFDMTGFYVGA